VVTAVAAADRVQCAIDHLDPHAWLLPHYRRLKAESAFKQTAPVTKFRRLLEAVARVSAREAWALERISPADQSAVLARLAVLDASPPPTPMQELWTVRKAERSLTCVAVHQAHGTDLRLLEGADFRRTTLIRDAAAVAVKSSEWRDKLLEAGWTGDAIV
jgi:hypothetical protein